MNRYDKELLPAHDEFSDKLRGKIDCHSGFHSIGICAWGDVVKMARELMNKAYKAGYADCKDDYARGNTNV